jgi:3-oxoacyl-[acyl-carrier protein] reductase
MDMDAGVAIVTGSSSGVGAACVKRLARLGANVVVNYSKSAQAAAEIAAECEALGVESLLIRADVSDDEACRDMVSQTIAKWGRVDALVNNAGTTKFVAHDDLEGLSRQDFLDIYAVNTVGAYQMTRAVVPHMKHGGRGSIVNVASVAAITGVGSSVAYAASKGALVTMTLSLARVLGPEIRVNCVCPGFIQGTWLADGMGRERYDAAKSFLEQSAPLRLTATPDTVAEAILYFVTGADIVTGETLILDGGAHLGQTPMVRR